MVKAGLEALGFGLIKELDRTALYHAVGLAERNRDLTLLYEVIERYNPAALVPQGQGKIISSYS